MKFGVMESRRLFEGGVGYFCMLIVLFTSLPLVTSAGFFFSDGFDSIRVYTPCGVSGNYSRVGFQGQLNSSAQEETPSFSGTFTAYDDCYFAITNFSYPAEAPGISFWSNGQPGENFTYAAPISPDLTTLESWPGQDTVVIYIEGGGLTWEDIGVVYVVCNTCNGGQGEILGSIVIEDVPSKNAGLAEVKLLRKQVQAAAKSRGIQAAPPPPSPSPPPPAKGNSSSTGPAAGFQNCIQGYPDRLNIYWTVIKDGDSYYVNYGLEARVGDNSWAGFGFSGNQAKAQSLFADVTVTGIISGQPKGFALDFYITSQQTCAEGKAGNFSGICQDKFLGDSQALNNVNLTGAYRKNDVSFVTYSKQAKTLDTTYDVDLMSSPTIFGNWYVVYAAGPLAPGSTSENPILLNHDESVGYFKGGTRITLNPTAEPVFSCTPLYGSKAQYHPPLAPYVAPPPAAPPPPPSSPSGLSKLSTCVATFQGKTEEFATCSILPGGFTFMWSLEGSAMTAVFIAQLQRASNWAAVGVSPNGAPAGSSLLAAYADSEGDVEVNQFFVAGVETSPVAVLGGNLSLTAAKAEIGGNILTVKFTIQLPSNQIAAAYLVWSKGGSVNGTQLSSDGVKGIYTSAISFQSGASSASSRGTRLAWGVHGAINAVAWGVILPLGGFVGRYIRRMSPFWFPFHRGMQLLGYWLGQVGFVTGLTMSHRGSHPGHLALGIVLFSLATIQIMAVVWRPEEHSQWREVWRRYHLSLGISIFLLAVVQIFVGLHVARASKLYVIMYVVWLVFLVVVVVGLEVQPYIPGLRGLTLFALRGEGGEPAIDGFDSEKWDSGYLGGWGSEKGHSGGVPWAAGAGPLQASPAVTRTEDGEARALALWEHLKSQVGDPDIPPPISEKKAEKARIPKFLVGGEKKPDKKSGELAARSRPVSGQLGEKRDDVETGVKESGQAKYLRMSSANEVADRRSGELGLAAAAAQQTADEASGEPSRNLPSPRPRRPRPPSPVKAKMQRSTSFSGPLGEAIRKLTSALPSRRDPIIKTDKYNVKATIVKPPDLTSLRRPFEKPAPKRSGGKAASARESAAAAAAEGSAAPSAAPALVLGPTANPLGHGGAVGLETVGLESIQAAVSKVVAEKEKSRSASPTRGTGVGREGAGKGPSASVDATPGGIGSPIELEPIRPQASAGSRDEELVVIVGRPRLAEAGGCPLGKNPFVDEADHRSLVSTNPFADPADLTLENVLLVSPVPTLPRRNLDYGKNIIGASGSGNIVSPRPILASQGPPRTSSAPIGGTAPDPFSRVDVVLLRSPSAPRPGSGTLPPLPRSPSSGSRVPVLPPPPRSPGSAPATLPGSFEHLGAVGVAESQNEDTRAELSQR